MRLQGEIVRQIDSNIWTPGQMHTHYISNMIWQIFKNAFTHALLVYSSTLYISVIPCLQGVETLGFEAKSRPPTNVFGSGWVAAFKSVV